MSTARPTERDERTVAVENASYRWVCTFLTFALLIDVMYRALARDEAAWDLFALVILGGAISTAYQAHHKTLPRIWGNSATLIGCVLSVVVAAVAAIIISWVRS